MKQKIFLDTLFIVALVNSGDQYHQQALILAAQYEGYSFLTTDVILLEVGNALARNYKNEAVEVIESFLGSDDVEIIRLTLDLFEKAFNLYKQYQDKAWGLVDCSSFVVMQQAGVNQALTFDRHFTQAGFQALMR